MSLKSLATATAATSMLRADSILVEIGGNIRRITLDKLMNAINNGNEQLLRQVAWGVPIKESQTSTAWGVVGNTDMFTEYESMSGRYMLSNTGYAAKLNPNDSAQFADGTTVVELRGHVMFWAPRLYYICKTDAQTGQKYLWCSMYPISSYYIEAPCVGAYKGSMVGNALVSRSGVAPAGAKTIDAFWSAAQENGSGFGLTNYDHQKFMLMKGLSKYGDTNIQNKLGYGVGGSTTLDLWATAATLLTGATKSTGDSYSKIDISVINGALTGTDCSRVNFGGIEDPYNWQYDMIQNVFFGSSANAGQTGTEIFIYEGNRMPSAAELAAVPQGKYRLLSRTIASNWVHEMILGEHFDIFAKTYAGGATSYWADQQNHGVATGQLLLWGGYAYYGANAGLGYAVSNNAFSSSYSYLGARLAYYGDISFVAGKQFMQLTA